MARNSASRLLVRSLVPKPSSQRLTSALKLENLWFLLEKSVSYGEAHVPCFQRLLKCLLTMAFGSYEENNICQEKSWDLYQQIW